MLKVKFEVLGPRNIMSRIASENEQCEVFFTDSAGDPFPSLVEGLICLHKSVEMQRSVFFYDEPAVNELAFRKHRDGTVTLVVTIDEEDPVLSYAGDCREVLMSFWRALRQLVPVDIQLSVATLVHFRPQKAIFYLKYTRY